jgi:hypothetical protein
MRPFLASDIIILSFYLCFFGFVYAMRAADVAHITLLL